MDNGNDDAIQNMFLFKVAHLVSQNSDHFIDRLLFNERVKKGNTLLFAQTAEIGVAFC